MSATARTAAVDELALKFQRSSGKAKTILGGKVYEAAKPELRRRCEAIVRKAGRPIVEAEDLLQSTLVRALEKIATWRGSNFVAWAKRIANNLYVDTVRSESGVRRPRKKKPSPLQMVRAEAAKASHEKVCVRLMRLVMEAQNDPGLAEAMETAGRCHLNYSQGNRLSDADEYAIKVLRQTTYILERAARQSESGRAALQLYLRRGSNGTDLETFLHLTNKKLLPGISPDAMAEWVTHSLEMFGMLPKEPARTSALDLIKELSTESFIPARARLGVICGLAQSPEDFSRKVAALRERRRVQRARERRSVTLRTLSAVAVSILEGRKE